MATWDVHGIVMGSVYIGRVEAETEEEATEKAWSLPNCHVSLCHQCSEQCEDPEISTISVHKVT